MRILLDTHFLIWLTIDFANLKLHEVQFLGEGHEILVSSVSIIEIRFKWRSLDAKGQPKGRMSAPTALELVRANDFAVMDLTAADVATALEPSLAHTDPFDELLLLHAQQLGAKLLTRDGALRDHPAAYSLA
ncbi:PIN domain-containing protein [Sphingomonas gei]|uniref:PIN domain-containing protein n=1 Tax=Sphingomonas gei TaxID=1395960 RepID=A0A4V3QZ41_9SPHN|nr:PIN domain-containing protein [Sphingomonas gei]TGX52752.1 PIN domain-containing protein [Sphingomonas gei]